MADNYRRMLIGCWVLLFLRCSLIIADECTFPPLHICDYLKTLKKSQIDFACNHLSSFRDDCQVCNPDCPETPPVCIDNYITCHNADNRLCRFPFIQIFCPIKCGMCEQDVLTTTTVEPTTTTAKPTTTTEEPTTTTTITTTTGEPTTTTEVSTTTTAEPTTTTDEPTTTTEEPTTTTEKPKTTTEKPTTTTTEEPTTMTEKPTTTTTEKPTTTTEETTTTTAEPTTTTTVKPTTTTEEPTITTTKEPTTTTEVLTTTTAEEPTTTTTEKPTTTTEEPKTTTTEKPTTTTTEKPTTTTEEPTTTTTEKPTTTSSDFTHIHTMPPNKQCGDDYIWCNIVASNRTFYCRQYAPDCLNSCGVCRQSSDTTERCANFHDESVYECSGRNCNDPDEEQAHRVKRHCSKTCCLRNQLNYNLLDNMLAF